MPLDDTTRLLISSEAGAFYSELACDIPSDSSAYCEGFLPPKTEVRRRPGEFGDLTFRAYLPATSSNGACLRAEYSTIVEDRSGVTSTRILLESLHVFFFANVESIFFFLGFFVRL